eukprot:SAG22_NODE_1408_length_4484_cov_9.346180_3_plen_139_part_00
MEQPVGGRDALLLLRARCLATSEARLLHRYCWTNFPFRAVDMRAVLHMLGNLVLAQRVEAVPLRWCAPLPQRPLEARARQLEARLRLLLAYASGQPDSATYRALSEDLHELVDLVSAKVAQQAATQKASHACRPDRSD